LLQSQGVNDHLTLKTLRRSAN